MKTKRLFQISMLLLGFLSFQMGHAQFLKKLKERVREKTEYVVLEKTSDKVAEKTSNTIDKAFEFNPFSKNGTGPVDTAMIPDEYQFSYQYTIKMITKKGDILFDYFLQPGADYFGFTSPQMENIFTVMDNGRKITAMFMNNQENSVLMANSMPDDLDVEEMADESAVFGYESLPEKEIMGYTCTGVKASNEQYEISMYFTSDTPISFNDIYKKQNKNIPAGLGNYFSQEDRVLMMEMQMVDLQNKKNNTTMECIGLEEVLKSIYKSDYNSMELNTNK